MQDKFPPLIKKGKIYWIFLLTGAFLGLMSLIYRFNHPEKTETQVLFDGLKGKWFKS